MSTNITDPRLKRVAQLKRCETCDRDFYEGEDDDHFKSTRHLQALKKGFYDMDLTKLPETAIALTDDIKAEIELLKRQSTIQFYDSKGKVLPVGGICISGIPFHLPSNSNDYAMMVCKICNAKLQSFSNWVSHFQGKTHAKKLRMKLSSHHCCWQKLIAGPDLPYYFDYITNCWQWDKPEVMDKAYSVAEAKAIIIA